MGVEGRWRLLAFRGRALGSCPGLGPTSGLAQRGTPRGTGTLGPERPGPALPEPRGPLLGCRTQPGRGERGRPSPTSRQCGGRGDLCSHPHEETLEPRRPGSLLHLPPRGMATAPQHMTPRGSPGRRPYSHCGPSTAGAPPQGDGHWAGSCPVAEGLGQRGRGQAWSSRPRGAPPTQAPGPTGEPPPTQAPPESPECEDTGTVSLEKLHSVRQLEALARAHTLLALMAWPSPACEEDCLVACTLLKRIWQVRGGVRAPRPSPFPSCPSAFNTPALPAPPPTLPPHPCHPRTSLARLPPPVCMERTVGQSLCLLCCRASRIFSPTPLHGPLAAPSIPLLQGPLGSSWWLPVLGDLVQAVPPAGESARTALSSEGRFAPRNVPGTADVPPWAGT